MASYTSNLGMKKPALDDDALITDINNNMDILDAAVNGVQDGLAIVANGNTHVAITAGQFVYVRNHSTLTEGLYVASTNIAANATLSTSNLTADAAGGLNALNSKIRTEPFYTGSIGRYTGDLNNAPSGVVFTNMGASNLPDSSITDSWYVTTIRQSDGNGVQYASPKNTSALVFVRVLSNSSWSSWEELALKSDIDTLKKNTGASAVDISSYSLANRYTTQYDGYLYISNNTGASGKGYVYGSNNATMVSVGGSVGDFSLFVRKGMQIAPYNSPSGAYFIPIA